MRLCRWASQSISVTTHRSEEQDSSFVVEKESRSQSALYPHKKTIGKGNVGRTCRSQHLFCTPLPTQNQGPICQHWHLFKRSERVCGAGGEKPTCFALAHCDFTPIYHLPEEPGPSASFLPFLKNQCRFHRCQLWFRSCSKEVAGRQSRHRAVMPWAWRHNAVCSCFIPEEIALSHYTQKFLPLWGPDGVGT